MAKRPARTDDSRPVRKSVRIERRLHAAQAAAAQAELPADFPTDVAPQAPAPARARARAPVAVAPQAAAVLTNVAPQSAAVPPVPLAPDQPQLNPILQLDGPCLHSSARAW